MKNLKKLLFVSLLLVIAAALVFAGGEAETAAEEGGGTLVFGKRQPAIALDPGAVDEGGSSGVTTQIFESLLSYEPGTTNLAPALAEDWEISDDGLEITFYLREGVKFHDGTEMDADAVVFSFMRQLDKDHPFHQYGPWKYWSSKGWSPRYEEDGTLKDPGVIKDVVKVDDYTVKVLLNELDTSIMYNFALYFTSIVSPTAAEKLGEDFKKQPVGTGPFKFVEWIKDDRVTLERFDDYWGEPAGVQRLIMKVYPDPTARSLALKKGEVDMIEPPDYDNLLQLMTAPNVVVDFSEIYSIGYVCFQVEKAPFDDVRVRRALNHAINKDEIIKGVYGVLGSPGHIPLPKDMWSYNEDIKPYGYDPEKAKALLAQAGYPDGFECELFALPVSRPYNPNGMKVAEIMQAQLAAVGVDADIISYDIGTYWDKVDAGEFDLCMTGWTGEGDPDDFLYNLFTEGYLNSARWYNDEYIDLVTQAKKRTSLEDRAELYEQAQEILHEEAPIIMLAYVVDSMPMRNRVVGYIPYPTGKLVLKHVRLVD